MPTQQKNIILFVLIMFVSNSFIFGSGKQKREITSINLRTAYLYDPINVDVPNPNLSWVLQAKSPDLKNISQSSYHVLVATNKYLLQKNIGNLWDSGVINSSNSTHVIYKGKKLHSRQISYWKVQVFDQNGEPSNWSSIAKWESALLNKNDWAGSQWIGLGKDDRNSPLSSRTFQTSKMQVSILKTSHASFLLRKEYRVSKNVKSAIAYVAGLGYYELYINGKKVGDLVLDPGQTDYDIFSLYVTYDITKYKDYQLWMRDDVNNIFYKLNMDKWIYVVGMGLIGSRLIIVRSEEHTSELQSH